MVAPFVRAGSCASLDKLDSSWSSWSSLIMPCRTPYPPTSGPMEGCQAIFDLQTGTGARPVFRPQEPSP